MTAVSKLGFKVINLSDKLIFAAQRTGKPISGLNADIKPNNFSN